MFLFLDISYIILHLGKLFHIKMTKTSFCHKSIVKGNNSHSPKRPIDVNRAT